MYQKDTITILIILSVTLTCVHVLTIFTKLFIPASNTKHLNSLALDASELRRSRGEVVDRSPNSLDSKALVMPKYQLIA